MEDIEKEFWDYVETIYNRMRKDTTTADQVATLNMIHLDTYQELSDVFKDALIMAHEGKIDWPTVPNLVMLIMRRAKEISDNVKSR